jgi:hypothetical protein
MTFSLKELESIELTLDPDPENPSIGFIGKIKQSTLDTIFEMRQAEHRRQQANTPYLRTLGHIGDYLEGWRRTILTEGGRDE